MVIYRRQAGFTLLEILIVVVIVAVVGGMVMSTIPSGITPQQQLSQSRELASYLRLEREESVMTSRSYGLRMTVEELDDGDYRYHGEWFVLDVDNIKAPWQPSQNIKPFSIERGYLLRLFIDEQQMVLPDYDTELEPANDEIASDDALKTEDGPQLFFMSSGELNDFAIELCREPKEPVCYRIEGNYLGRITLDDGDDKDES